MALDWYDSQFHAGIAAFARKENWVLNTHMARTRQFPIGWEGDGVIALIDLHSTTAGFIRSMKKPVIDLGGHFTEFSQVLSDNHQVGVMAAEHFLENNHTRFVFLHVQSSRLEQEISTGFASAIKAAGYSCEMVYWQQTAEEHSIDYRAVQSWAVDVLKKIPKPVAVSCQNDDTAAIILNAAFDAGLQIPEEIAILGVGNDELVCEFQPRTLSSIDPGLYHMGYRAACELASMMKGRPARKSVLRVPPKGLVLRESTDFLAVSNPHVLTVLRHIWRHYDEPLDIDKLTSLVPVSRSTLYNLFLEEVGRPMVKELTRVRINHAKLLLRTTRQSIGDVASACGFSGLIAFSRAFSHNAEMSPSEYRQQMRGEDAD